MPELILQVVSLDAAPPVQAMMRAFDDDGGTIGRDDSNAMMLPDKHRRVSRLHATISFPGGMPTITNSSSSLPISIGEQQLDSGESMPIAHGVLIEIGPYLLKANVGAHAQTGVVPVSTPVVRHDSTPTLVPVSGFAPHRPNAAPIPAPTAQQVSQSIGEFSDLLGPASTPPPVAIAPQAQSIGADWPGQTGGNGFGNGASLIPERPSASKTLAPAAAPVDDPFADLLAGISAPPSPYAGESRTSSVQPRPGLSADPLIGLSGVVPLSGGVSIGHHSAEGFGGSRQPAAVIPNDFNPFELPSSSDRNAADPLAGLLGEGGTSGDGRSLSGGSASTPSIDSLFQSVGPHTSSSDTLFGATRATQEAEGALHGLLGSDGGSDPFALFDSPVAAPNNDSKPMRDDTAEIGSAFAPPLARSANWASPPPAQQPQSAVMAAPLAPTAIAPTTPMAALAPQMPMATASPDALTEAFLRGAGLAPTALPNGLTPEIMAIVGSLLRSATAGAVDMLAARAATKREVQASVTIISVQANNPLKFLPNADAALLQLLGKKMPGFMRADVAMRDAFDDLRAHEVGVIAGTRAALTEVLGKFDPSVLGDKLTRGSVLDSLMPSARKAKLWDLYLERYLQIRREAEDDFQSIFGRAFVQAYERETARIKGESPIAGGERG